MDEDPPDYRAELIAMMAIGDALTALPSPESRARVLRWGLEHFAPAVVATGPQGVNPSPRADGRGTRALLDADPFEELADAARRNTARVLAMRPPSEATAADAYAAIDTTAEDLVEACNALDAEPQIARPAKAARSDGTVFEEFVAEFQRVAREWPGEAEPIDAHPLAAARERRAV